MESNTRYIEILQNNKDLLQSQFAVSSLVVFGSVARNEITEQSDVDVFVQMPPKMVLVVGVKQYLESKNLKVILTREPGGSKTAEQIRNILLSPQSTISPICELMLYESARAQHFQEIIKPNLFNMFNCPLCIASIA